MRVYIESTIPSLVVARATTEREATARQEITREWWKSESQKHELYISEVVLNEIERGDEQMAAQRCQFVQRLPILEVTKAVEEAAKKILFRAVADNGSRGRHAHCCSILLRDGYIAFMELSAHRKRSHPTKTPAPDGISWQGAADHLHATPTLLKYERNRI